MESIIGKTFNRLTVLSETGRKTKNRSKIFLCECVCGNVKEIASNKLKNGTKSCGCLKAENLDHSKGKFHRAFGGYEGISLTFWNYIRDNAKRRGKEFNITIQFAWSLFLSQNKKCALSGVDLRLSDSASDRRNKSITASLDRIDSSKGYIEGNVQWVHKDINYMKWKIPQEKFLDFCRKVVYFQDKGIL